MSNDTTNTESFPTNAVRLVYRDGVTGVRQFRFFETREEAQAWVKAWNAAQGRRHTGVRYETVA